MVRARVDVFRRDLEELARRMGMEDELRGIIDKLSALHLEGAAKINHSPMELVVAGYLIRRGYEVVEVEHRLSDLLVCDVYGVRGVSSIVVEVETGFTPPSNALDPTGYIRARIASKIARYSHYAGKMSIAVPPFYAPLIPRTLLKPPRERSEEELVRLKTFLDKYYRHPPVTLEELSYARLHTLMVVDVDNAVVEELDPQRYYEALAEIVEAYSNRFQHS